jgi:hypothetical protein
VSISCALIQPAVSYAYRGLQTKSVTSSQTQLNAFNFLNNKKASVSTKATGSNNRATVVRKYFEYWNERDMVSATDLFADDCIYEDTLYPGQFTGKVAIQKHLVKVALSLPGSFEFVIDDVSEDAGRGTVGVKWHVESEGEQLPFTRGCSLYKGSYVCMYSCIYVRELVCMFVYVCSLRLRLFLIMSLESRSTTSWSYIYTSI